jgi:P27 family predicted phage terminase small subunit
MPNNRKPLATLKLAGSKHAKYERGKEPVSPPGQPQRPDNLNDLELEVWDYITDKLDAMGVLAITDGKSIERYAYTYVRFWTAAEFVRKNGETFPVRDKDGNLKGVQLLPQANLLNTLGPQLLKLEQEFGLTPSSRAGIKLEKQQIEDKAKQKFFG